MAEDERDEAQEVLDYAGELSKYSLLLRGGENINSVETLYSAYWSLLQIFQAVLGDLKLGPEVLKGEAVSKFLALTKSNTKKIKARPVKPSTQSNFSALPLRVQNLLRALIDLNSLQSQKESSITTSMSNFYYTAAAEASRCIINEIETLKKVQEQLHVRGDKLFTESIHKLLGNREKELEEETTLLLRVCKEKGLGSVENLVALKALVERLTLPKLNELPSKLNKIEYDENTESALNLRLASHTLHSNLQKQQLDTTSANELASIIKISKVIKQEMDAKLGHSEILQSQREKKHEETQLPTHQEDPHLKIILDKITSVLDQKHALEIESIKIRNTIDNQMDSEYKQRSEESRNFAKDTITEFLRKLKLLLAEALEEHKKISKESATTQKLIAAELKQIFDESFKLYKNHQLKDLVMSCVEEIEEASKNGRMERDMLNFSEHKQELHQLLQELKIRLEQITTKSFL